MASYRLMVGALLLGTFGCSLAAQAQELVLDGLYDCARATNGRTYCRQRATKNYTPVSEEFYQRYQAIRTGAPGGAPATVTQTQTNQQQINNTTNINIIVDNLDRETADIEGQMALLSKVIEEQRELKSSGREASVAVDRTLAAIQSRMDKLKSVHSDKTKERSKYQTNVRPINENPYITARKASEIYPKIPYYIPGTKEIGEFWVEPQVSDEGQLIFKFRFIDTGSQEDKTRAVIEMRPGDLERTQKALLKLYEWSEIAQEKKIRKSYTKRLDCFPMENCPPEGQKIDGKASTEILFEVDSDGATNGRIQRNKGRFEEAYNVSVESGLMLQAYMRYVLKEGRQEHEAGSQTKEDLDKIFN
jgi:hypothetical protein